MISVIHPSSSHFPAMGPGSVAGARVPFAHPGLPHPGSMHSGFTVSSSAATTGSNPAMANYGHQLMMAAKAGEQISDLYRRRDSGYTHHVSNSNYHHIPTTGTATPQVQVRGSNPQQQQQQSLQRSSSSRSLSSYLASSGSSRPVSGPMVSTASTSLSKVQPKSKPRGLIAPPAGKDLSSPLFVDCSIEYELPNAPKIPKNSAPILMIHPGYQKPQRVTPRVVQLAKPKAVPAVAATATPASAQCNGHRGGACQCPPSNTSNVTSTVKNGRGIKRSYATAMSNDFYKHLNQPQPHPQQSAG